MNILRSVKAHVEIVVKIVVEEINIVIQNLKFKFSILIYFRSASSRETGHDWTTPTHLW